MSKVILAMDDPMRCIDCPMAKYVHMDGQICGMKRNIIDVNSKTRPDWCPLKSAPEKDEECYLLEYSAGYKRGWNDCINYLIDE